MTLLSCESEKQMDLYCSILLGGDDLWYDISSRVKQGTRVVKDTGVPIHP